MYYNLTGNQLSISNIMWTKESHVIIDNLIERIF